MQSRKSKGHEASQGRALCLGAHPVRRAKLFLPVIEEGGKSNTFNDFPIFRPL
jgi:hypothetical protein